MIARGYQACISIVSILTGFSELSDVVDFFPIFFFVNFHQQPKQINFFFMQNIDMQLVVEKQYISEKK